MMTDDKTSQLIYPPDKMLNVKEMLIKASIYAGGRTFSGSDKGGSAAQAQQR